MRALRHVAVLSTLLVGFAVASPSCVGQTGGQPSEPPAARRPQPDALGRYKVGNGVTVPHITYSVDPSFTDKASKKRVQGVSVLSLTVGVDGMPHDITVVYSIANMQPPKLRSIAKGLDEEAIKAVEQYRFKPATLDGSPVPVRINIEVNFQLF
jgi:TonB family protein